MDAPAGRWLLSCLNVKGEAAAADAMHCQREPCALISKAGGDYPFGLKGNQGMLHKDVATCFNDAGTLAGAEIHKTIEKNGGRIEKRVCRKLPDIKWLQKQHKWPGLRSVFSVERIVTVGSKTTKEMSFYISSADLSAQRLMAIARNH